MSSECSWTVVDDDGLKWKLLEGKKGMKGSIMKLEGVPDWNGR